MTSKVTNPKATTTCSPGILALFAVSGFFWAYVLYSLWRTSPRWTSLVAMSLLALVTVLFFLAQFTRRASLKTMVFVIPLLMAFLCLPLRVVLESASLRQSLVAAGASESVTSPTPMWYWAADTFGLSFHTQLESVSFDLEFLQVDKFADIPTHHLNFISIRSELATADLAPELIDWCNSCPRKPSIRIHLEHPSAHDLELLRRLQLPTRLELRGLPADSRRFSIPLLEHLQVHDAELTSEFASERARGTQGFEPPPLSTLTLNGCRLSEGSAIQNVTPSTYLRLYNCEIVESPESLFDAPTLHLRLGNLSVPQALSFPSQEQATCPPDNTLMFFGSQFGDEDLLAIARYRKPIRLSVVDSVPLAESTVHALIQSEFIEYLILGGSWITPDHLTPLGQVRRPFTLRLRGVDLPSSKTDRISQGLHKDVRLILTRNSTNR